MTTKQRAYLKSLAMQILPMTTQAALRLSAMRITQGFYSGSGT